jgi:4-hydroxy-2-oxoheptanedioate aldolase
VVKQALDIGLMGIMGTSVESRKDAENYVTYMRYPPQRSGPPALAKPVGRRGYGAAIASWNWGVPEEVYIQHADLWPLNPQGDLLFWPMIETADGLKNLDAILQTPGVGGIYLSTGGDISMSLGVPYGDPAVKEFHMTAINICKARKVACGGSVTEGNIEEYIKAGYRILRGNEASIRKARAILKED